MGFLSFIKKLFTCGDVDKAALNAVRARHGIKVDENEKVSVNESPVEIDRSVREYNVWEEIRNYRSNFFFGSWATRKFHPFGEDKVKKQLAELEKKREEERKKKEEESNNIPGNSGAP